MFGWICLNFTKINKLFFVLLLGIIFQQNVLFAQVDSQVNLPDVSGAQKILGDIPELFENPEDKLDGKSGELDINSMQDFFQEMLKIWAEAKKREEAQKLLFFSKLSPEDQELLKIAQAKYNKFLENVDIRNGLALLCKNVRSALKNLPTDQLSNAQVELLEIVLVKIEKLQTAIALDYCQFLPKRMKGMSSKGIEDLPGAMNGLMQNLMPDEQKVNVFTSGNEGAQGAEDSDLENADVAFSLEDLRDFCKSLYALMHSGAFKCVKNEEQELITLKTKAENAIKVLNDIVLSIFNNKPKDLILHYIAYLDPEFNDANQALKQIQKAFEVQIKKHITNQPGGMLENEQDLSGEDIEQKAYIFWYKEIRKFQRTMLVFSTLRSSTESSVVGTEKLFETVAYAYDIAACFYDFYKNDRDSEIRKTAQASMAVNTPLTLEQQEAFERVPNWNHDVLIPMAVDWGISGFMASWFFCLKSPDVTNGLLLQSILGNMPLNMVDVKQATVLNFMVIPFAVSIFLNPSGSNWQVPKLAKTLGKVAGAWGYYHIFYGKLFGHDHSFGWDPDYNHIKNSTYELLIEVEKIVSKSFVSAIRYRSNPETIENIEDWTLGIVKPEMIAYFAESFIPLLLFDKYEHVQSPVFGTRGLDFLASKPGSAYIAQYQKFDEETKNRVSLKEYYVEACISYYIASSVGKTFGVALAKKVQGPCLNFAEYAGGKFLDGLAWLHIIGEDTREMFTSIHEEFAEGIDENIMILKMLFKNGFEQNSPFKKMLVKHLKSRGDIEINKKASEEDINKELLYFILKQCAQQGLMTYLDQATIMKSYLLKNQFDDELIEIIIATIKKNMLAPVGAWVGSLVATNALKMLIHYQGPIQRYPTKIKNAIWH